MEAMAEEFSIRPSRRHGLRKYFMSNSRVVVNQVIVEIAVTRQLNFPLEAFNPCSKKQIRMSFCYMTPVTRPPFPHVAPHKAV
jgi:hypothetical protein